MNENIIEAKYNITKQSKVKLFYNKYKTLIFIIATFIILSIFCLLYYANYKESKKVELSHNYFKAKIYIQNNQNEKAVETLNSIIFEDDNTYSSLALFLIVNENLIVDNVKLSELFDHVLEKNTFNDDIRNLIIFKRALIKSNVNNELEMLEATKLITQSDSVWKPHALLLLGDYFSSKKEYIKSKEFYAQILQLKNLNENFYFEANSRLALINNEK
jgi:hypothetical protein